MTTLAEILEANRGNKKLTRFEITAMIAHSTNKSTGGVESESLIDDLMCLLTELDEMEATDLRTDIQDRGEVLRADIATVSRDIVFLVVGEPTDGTSDYLKKFREEKVKIKKEVLKILRQAINDIKELTSILENANMDIMHCIEDE